MSGVFPLASGAETWNRGSWSSARRISTWPLARSSADSPSRPRSLGSVSGSFGELPDGLQRILARCLVLVRRGEAADRQVQRRIAVGPSRAGVARRDQGGDNAGMTMACGELERREYVLAGRLC